MGMSVCGGGRPAAAGAPPRCIGGGPGGRGGGRGAPPGRPACASRPNPGAPSAASRTTREDFQMAVGFLFLVLHKESETFLKFPFWITKNKRALLPIRVAGT